MSSRRDFLQKSAGLSALGLVGIGSAQAAAQTQARLESGQLATDVETSMAPPPDLFDAQALDVDFWLKPRTLSLIRPQSGERAKVLYWKDGEVIDSAYQELCHLLRDVNGKASEAIDPKLFETLWGTQAFVARYGMDRPLEILSGYRTPASNAHLREQGIPAARQSLHMVGKAADIRIAALNEEVLGGLIRSFRTGGVGYYYRSGPKGGWIHTDTGLNRTWKG
jgi:uncharacterized protein YcbK (DUF882 family)